MLAEATCDTEMQADGVDNDPLPTRASLLSRIRDVSENESWSEFFDLYWKLIYNMARAAGLSDTEAQDVVQETMISVSKAIPGFKYDPAKGSFKSWLANITRWRITDQFRKRLGLEPEEAASHVPDRDTFTARWDTEWEKNLVSAAIARARANVPPRSFQIYSLCELQRKGVKETARVLNTSVAAVYLCNHRVTREIRRQAEILRRKEHGGE